MGDDLERKAITEIRAGGRSLRLLVSLTLMLTAGACVARPAMVEAVAFESRTYGFVDQLLAGEPGEAQQAEAVLVLPESETFKPPYPALVLLHTSNGQGSQDWLYAQRLREEGVAVLAVDSFSPRDVDHTVRDQTLVSTASMLADAYGGLRFLLADPRIDPRRIGVIGFSKGGIAALYAGYEAIRQKLAFAEARFALHVAYYPWCGLRLRRPVTTGAPILIQSGALDDLVPPERCAELAAATRGPEGPNNMTLVVHPGGAATPSIIPCWRCSARSTSRRLRRPSASWSNRKTGALSKPAAGCRSMPQTWAPCWQAAAAAGTPAATRRRRSGPTAPHLRFWEPVAF